MHSTMANTGPQGNDPMRKLTYSILGAAAVAAGVLLVRQQKADETEQPRVVPAGETVPAVIQLDRLRELGI